MISLVIGAGGLLLVIGGFLAFLVRAVGEPAGALLVIVLGSVLLSAIIAFFSVLLGNGLEEVFFRRT